MKILDWLVILAYLAYVIWDGVRRSAGSRSAEGYFLAGRTLPWWAVGLSVMATQMSAITLVGTTGQAYSNGMRFIQFYYGLPFAMIILCMTVVPFFYRAKVFTAYEYLEKRFDARTRTLTSLVFLVSRCLGVGVIISAPSVILSIVLGWNLPATVFAIGITTTFYTMIGGVQAVTWTDVKQMLVIIVGLGICLYVILDKLPVSFSQALEIAGATDRLTTIDARFDSHETYTLWSGLIGGFFLMLSYFGCDQSQVQRYLSAKSVSDGRISLLMSAFLKIPIQFGILLIGVMVFVFYQFERPPLNFNRAEESKIRTGSRGAEYRSIEEKFQQLHETKRKLALGFIEALNAHDTATAKIAQQSFLSAEADANRLRDAGSQVIRDATSDKTFNDVNFIFPTFVVENMPAGIIGIIIAAIFAAAMSSISAELNALATASVIDVYKRHLRPAASDGEYVWAGRIATLFWGLFACIVALYATSLGSLIEVVNKFGSFFYGSLLGVFILAIIIKRATAQGAFFGLLFGMGAVWIVSLTTNISFLWYNVVGSSVVVITGYLISLFKPQENLRRENLS